MTSCKQCSKLTKNSKFCSRSCAASFNNKKSPKRIKKLYFCLICGAEVPSERKYCLEHNPLRADWSAVTIKKATDSVGKQANKFRRIRDNSRSIYLKSDKPKVCVNCGYKKHFDVCHKKDITDFPIDTPISIVNSLNNLIALCPNCHWESHNGHLDIHLL